LIKVSNLKSKQKGNSLIHTNNPIIKHKAGLLNLPEELGNVSKACKVMGVSRDKLYRYQELVEDGGIENPINKSRRAPKHKESSTINVSRHCWESVKPKCIYDGFYVG
jgi:winged helix-turn helix protein